MARSLPLAQLNPEQAEHGPGREDNGNMPPTLDFPY